MVIRLFETGSVFFTTFSAVSFHDSLVSIGMFLSTSFEIWNIVSDLRTVFVDISRFMRLINIIDRITAGIIIRNDNPPIT